MSHTWSPEEFVFQPYALGAVKLEPEQSKGEALSPSAQRKAGRHKRSSILCQVELISSKTYCKRYRICMEHCNAASLVIEGRRQRFCQQCGRFHELVEFDGARKSCRYKLKRHNERRRGSGPSKSKKGNDSEDEDMVSSEDEAELAAMANMQRNSTRARSARKKATPATWDNTNDSTEESIQEDVKPMLLPAWPTSMAVSGSGNNLTENDSLHQPSGSGSDTPAQTAVLPPALTAINSNYSRQTGPTDNDILNCLDRLIADGDVALGGEEDDTLLQLLQETTGPTGSSASLPLFGTHFKDDAVFNERPLAHHITANRVHSAPVDSLELDLDLCEVFADVPMMPVPSVTTSNNNNINRGMLRTVASLPAPVQGPIAPAGVSQHVFDAARGMTNPLAAAEWEPSMKLEQDDRLIRMSLKVFNCTPDVLLPAVKSHLESLLSISNTMLEGYVRPGCTHLTLNVLADSAMQAQIKSNQTRSFVQTMLDHGSLGPTITDHMMIQINDELVIVQGGNSVAVIDTNSSLNMVPRIAGARPLATVAASSTCLLLAGKRISDDSDLVMCRQQGRNLTVEPIALPVIRGFEIVQVKVLGLVPGFAEFEVQRGSFLSAARPLLVLPAQNEAVVAEIRQLEHNQGGVGNVDDFIRSLGLVVQYLDRENAAAAGRPVPVYTPALLERFSRMACSIAAVAAARGWTATLQMVLPAVTAGNATDIVAALNAACPPQSTFLHLVVGTGNAALLQVLADWSRSARVTWQLDARGKQGVTPLHLVALFSDGCLELRAVLRQLSPNVADKLWSLVEADDGTTPESLYDALTSRTTALEGSTSSKYSNNDSTSIKVSSSAGSLDQLLRTPTRSKAREEAKSVLVARHIESMAEAVKNLSISDHSAAVQGSVWTRWFHV